MNERTDVQTFNYTINVARAPDTVGARSLNKSQVTTNHDNRQFVARLHQTQNDQQARAENQGPTPTPTQTETNPPGDDGEEMLPPRPIPPSRVGFRAFLTGALTSAAARIATKQTLTLAGLYGYPLALAAGTAAGAMIAGGTDLATQYKAAEELPSKKRILWTDYVETRQKQNRPVDYLQVMKQSDSEGFIEVPTEKSTLKNILHKLGQTKKMRLLGAIAKGAACGFVGAAVGSLAIDLIDGALRGDLGFGFRLPEGVQPPTITPPDLSPPNIELPPSVPPPAIIPPGIETPFTPDSLPPSTSVEIQQLPALIDLPQGSNIWNQSSRVLEGVLNRVPTNAEILQVSQEIARQSNVAVPEWGINGAVLHTRMPVGYDVIFNNNVKNVIEQIARRR